MMVVKVKKFAKGGVFEKSIPKVTLDPLETIIPLRLPPDIGERFAVVVYCKYCKHFRRNNENDTYCGCVGGLTDPEENDFCSYGERKDDGLL